MSDHATYPYDLDEILVTPGSKGEVLIRIGEQPVAHLSVRDAYELAARIRRAAEHLEEHP